VVVLAILAVTIVVVVLAILAVAVTVVVVVVVVAIAVIVVLPVLVLAILAVAVAALVAIHQWHYVSERRHNKLFPHMSLSLYTPHPTPPHLQQHTKCPPLGRHFLVCLFTALRQNSHEVGGSISCCA